MDKQPNPAIERYLLKRMSPDEQRAFEKLVSTEPDLALELAFYQALWLERDDALRRRWAAKGKALLHGEPALESPAVKKPAAAISVWIRPYRWAVAATFAVLLAATGYWFMSNFMGRVSYETLYEKQYQSFTDAQLLSSSDAAPVQQTWKQAFGHYTAKQYPEALQTLELLKAEPAYRQQAYLLAGFCYLELKLPNEAIREFQQVERQALSLYNKAQFHIALAHIQARNKEAARVQLQRVADDGANTFRERARLLLHDLAKIQD